MEHFQNSNASRNYNNISTKTIIHFCLSREESVSQSLYVNNSWHVLAMPQEIEQDLDDWHAEDVNSEHDAVQSQIGYGLKADIDSERIRRLCEVRTQARA